MTFLFNTLSADKGSPHRDALLNGYMSHRQLLPTLSNDLPKGKQYERCG